MSLLSIIVTLVIIGVILWAINRYVPMDAKIRKVLNVVVTIVVVLWLLYVFGILGNGGDVEMPVVR